MVCDNVETYIISKVYDLNIIKQSTKWFQKLILFFLFLRIEEFFVYIGNINMLWKYDELLTLLVENVKGYGICE